MIVTCNACQTRFRVPGERLGPQGARIRCSRCQTVFVVTPPEGGPAAEGAAASTPEPSGLAPRQAPAVPPDDPFAPRAPAPGAEGFAPRPPAAAAADDPFAPPSPRAPPPVPADDPFAAPPRTNDHEPGARALDSSWDPFGVARRSAAPGDAPPAPEREVSGGLTLESGGLELARGGRLARGGLDLEGPGPDLGPLGDAGFELTPGGPDSMPGAPGPDDGLDLDSADLGADLLGPEVQPPGPVGPRGILDDFGPEPLPPQEGVTGVGGLPSLAVAPPPLASPTTRPAPLAPARAAPPPPRSRAGAVVVNALSLALLLALAGLLIRAQRGGDGWGLGGRARGGPVAASGVRGGLYETAAGAPVLVIRGEVRAQEAVSGPVRVRVDLVDADQVVATSTALAGATATPEEVWAAELPDGLTDLRRALDARAAGALARGAAAPFLVLFPAPAGLHGLGLRVTASPDVAGGPP